MGRVTRWGRNFLLILTVVFTVTWMSGCGAGEDTQKEQPVSNETVRADKSGTKEKESEEAGEIPDELLPGQGNEDSKVPDNQESQSQEQIFDASDNDPDGNAPDSSGSGGGQSADSRQESNQEAGQPEASQMQIHVSVESSAVGNPVSYDGTVTLEQGATAYDALTALCGGQISGSGSYVTGIGGLSEKDYGSKSGWMYSVNGTYPNKGSSGYTLRDGDAVVWSYVK